MASLPKIIRHKTALVAALLIGTIASGAGYYAYQQHHRYKHFAVHEPGKVYRSAWVEPDVFQEVIKKEGIKTVVNLCEIGEMGIERNEAQRKAIADTDARLIELPFTANNTFTIDHPAVAEMERILDDPANYPIWIHCQHGRERTAKAIAMYDLREKGRTAGQTMDAQPEFGMPRPYHIIVFTHLYEEQLKQRLAETTNAPRR